jgi:hypothetical protein
MENLLISDVRLHEKGEITIVLKLVSLSEEVMGNGKQYGWTEPPARTGVEG